MTDWVATTENGARWIMTDGVLRVFKEDRLLFRTSNDDMKVVDRELIPKDIAEGWEYLRNLPCSDIPEIGKSMYASSLRSWRLSSRVVDIQITKEYRFLL